MRQTIGNCSILQIVFPRSRNININVPAFMLQYENKSYIHLLKMGLTIEVSYACA